jgi:hypothetical protein
LRHAWGDGSGAIDFGKVNVQFTSGAAVKTIGHVIAKANCTTDRGGWY